MNYETIKSAALALLVLISLAFTWGIWNYQPSYQTIEDGANESIVTEVKMGQQRQISDLLKPSQILSHQGGQHYGTISEKELNWIMKEMKKWTFSEPENISRPLNEQEFSKLLSDDKHVELFFPSSLPFDTLNTLISFSETPVPNAVFNRMIITEAEQENKAFVYFVSLKERLVFRSQVQTSSLEEFKQRYVENNEHLEPYLSYQIPNGSLLYVRKEPLILPVHGYLVEQIDADMFKRALFNDPSYVKRGSSSNIEEYTDGEGLMRVHSSTGKITYANLAETETNQAISLNQLIEQSVEFLNEHSGWVNDYRLFQAEPNSSTIGYRMFLGDFPLFNQQRTTEILQTWGRERIFKYERSTFILSNLRTNDERRVMLKSGQEALDQVMQLESIDPKLLTDMRIGYEVTLKQESLNYVLLEPFWYYEYDGEWMKLVADEGGQADGLE